MQYLFLVIGSIFLIDAFSTIINPMRYQIYSMRTPGVPKSPFVRFLASGCAAAVFLYLSYHFW
jgi:hypothetical protein